MRTLYLYIVVALFFYPACSNKEPYISNIKSVYGFIIKRETCHNDVRLDDWLLALRDDQALIGDSLTVDGEIYLNVVKLKGLLNPLRQPGMAVAIDYNVISKDKILPDSCNNPSPEIYALKQIEIVNQFEVR